MITRRAVVGGVGVVLATGPALLASEAAAHVGELEHWKRLVGQRFQLEGMAFSAGPQRARQRLVLQEVSEVRVKGDRHRPRSLR